MNNTEADVATGTMDGYYKRMNGEENVLHAEDLPIASHPLKYKTTQGNEKLWSLKIGGLLTQVNYTQVVQWLR